MFSNLTREILCQEATLNRSANGKDKHFNLKQKIHFPTADISAIIFYANERCDDGNEFMFGDCRPISVESEESEE